MPIYNYECSECQNVFEAFRKISERNQASELTCPACNKQGVSNYIMSAPMIVSDIGSIGPLGKTDSGWKEVLSKVKETHTINNIKT